MAQKLNETVALWSCRPEALAEFRSSFDQAGPPGSLSFRFELGKTMRTSVGFASLLRAQLLAALFLVSQKRQETVAGWCF